MSKCKYCGEQIRWVKLQTTEKSMPCNMGLIPYWKDPKGDKRIVTQDGEMVRCRLEGEQEEITNVGYELHFDRCEENVRMYRSG